jgi:HSP20 family molecular chaperone IbpA
MLSSRNALETFGSNWHANDHAMKSDWWTHEPATNSCYGGTTCCPLLTTDVVEKGDFFFVFADLPGVELADIEVSIHGRRLIIKADRKPPIDIAVDKMLCNERISGKIERTIHIPNSADIDNPETVFKNGVLTISFPKTCTDRKLAIHTA